MVEEENLTPHKLFSGLHMHVVPHTHPLTWAHTQMNIILKIFFQREAEAGRAL